MTSDQIPSRYRAAAVPHVMVEGAEQAMNFYAEAFGAKELFKISSPNGTVLHAEMMINGSTFMLGDADAPFSTPSHTGGTTVGLHVFVDSVDAFAAAAVQAGAELLQEPTDMFYGDRTVMLRDPFGHLWVFLTHQEDLSVAEIERRGNELLGQ